MVTFRIELASAPNRDGNFAIRLRITSQRKHRRISLGFSVPKKDYNQKATLDKANWIRSTSSNAQLYNTRISQEISLLQEAVTRLRTKTNDPALEDILQELQIQQEGSFLEFCRDRLKNNVFPTLAFQTAKQYEYVINKLDAFLIKNERINKEGKPVMVFSEVTLGFLKDFEAFIRAEGCSVNTAANQMGCLQRFVTEAFDDDLIKKNPFAKYTFKSEPISRGYLTIEQIQKMEALNLRYDLKIGPSRDIWLFMYYSHGSRIGDTLFLKVGDIEQVGLNYRLVYRMHKSKSSMNILMSAQALEIYLKYAKGKQAGDFLFPFLKPGLDYKNKKVFASETAKQNTSIYYNLQKIAKLIGVTELTAHMARHSFAQNSNDVTNDLYAISKALGHKKIATTEIYLKELNQGKIDRINIVYYAAPKKEQE